MIKERKVAKQETIEKKGTEQMLTGNLSYWNP